MIEILIPIFSVWFSALTLSFSEWLMTTNILYVHFDGSVKCVYFNKYPLLDSYKVPVRLKPLDCELCLAWWLGLSYHFYLSYNLIESVIVGGVCSFFAVLIHRLIKKV